MNTNTKFGKLSKKLKRALEKKLKLDDISHMLGGGISKRVAEINRDIDSFLLNRSYVELIDPLKEHRQLAEERTQRISDVDYSKEGYFNSEQIRKYINGKSGLMTYNACALAAFAGLKPNEFPYLKDGSSPEENKNIFTLSRGWDVYLYDSNTNAIKQTALWLTIDPTDNQRLSPIFVAPWNTQYHGEGRLADNDNLVLELVHEDNDRPIYISAKIPASPKKELGIPLILNAIGMSSGGKHPIIGSLILVKNDEANDRDSFIEKGIKNISYIENPPPSSWHHDTLMNQIFIYLTRHQDRTIDPFRLNTKHPIESRNNAYLIKKSRDSYSALKSLLSNKTQNFTWYSFSRIHRRSDRVGIFEWSFKFNNGRQEVIATRHRINRPEQRFYSGEVTIQSEHLYIEMEDKKKDNRKYFISDFPDEEESATKLRGISATTTITRNDLEPKRIGVREILLYMPRLTQLKNSELQEGYITYTDFLELDENYVTIKDKLYLSKREVSTLTYPSISDFRKTYARQKKALKHADQYYLFLPHHPEGRYKLLVLPLTIDKVGNVTCNIPKKEQSDTYQGYIEAYSNNLHIRLEFMPETEKQQRIMTLAFNTIKEGWEQKLIPVYSGLVINRTSRGGNVMADRFLMLKKEDCSLKKDDSDTLDLKSTNKSDKKFTQFLQNVIQSSSLPGSNIRRYFFQ